MKHIIKQLITFLIAFSLVSCTSLKPVNMTTSELQKQIPTGGVVSVNDEIKLGTTSGQSHQFVVTGITNTHILGKKDNIPVNTITSVQKVKTSIGKTVGISTVVIGIATIAFGYWLFDDILDNGLND